MKKRIIEFLLLSVLAVCHFVFWYAHYGYLNAAYSNAYFDTSFGLLSDALAYRGMMRYAENFLLAFFRWRGVGISILFVPVLCVYFITRAILNRIHLKSLNPLAFLPAIVLMISQHFEHFFLQKSLVVLLMMIVVYAHIVLKNNKWRFILLLALPLSVLFLSDLELALLFFALSLVEFISSTDNQRYFLSVFYLIFGVVSLVLYIVHLPTTPIFQVETPLLIAVQLLFVVLWIVLSKFGYALNRIFEGKTSWLFYLLMLFAVGFTFISNEQLEKKEVYACLDMALLNDEADEILALVKGSYLNDSQELSPYLFYALALKGQLPQSLFQYKPNKTNILPESLPLYASSQSVLSICFYRKLGLLNEAIHQAFQMGISCERTDNFRSLCLLADLNMERGNLRVAEKYLTKLEQTLVHTDFVRTRREQMASMQQPAEVDFTDYLYINKDQFMNISYALFFAKNESEFVKDYFLCALLLTGEYEMFCNYYKELYPDKKCRKRVYAEALLMARDMRLCTWDVEVASKVEQDWMQMKNIIGNRWLSRQEREKKFLAYRNTWWWYYLKEYEHWF